MRSRCMVDGKLLIQNWARFTVARRVWTSRAKYGDSILQEHTPVANILVPSQTGEGSLV